MNVLKLNIQIGLAACLLLVCSVGHAQGLRGTGALTLGPKKRDLGLNAGEFKLFPYLKVGYGYDSNLFYSDDTQWEQPEGSQLLRVVPGVRIQNRNTRNISLRFKGEASVDQYVTSNETVREHSNVGADISLGATFFQSSPVALTLSEQFRRALERRNFESARNYNRNVNRIGGGLIFKPGGGALEVKTTYTFAADLFSDTGADWGDLLYHEARVAGTWKFFPFTALVLDANWQIRDYLSEDQGLYGELTDSMPLRVRVGVNGFLTKKLSLMLLLGYGNSFHDDHQVAAGTPLNPNENDDFNMLIGEARVSFKFSDNTVLQGGYQYDFEDSLFTNWVQYHKVYVNFLQRIANRVDLEADVAYLYRIYSQLPRAYFEEATSPQIKSTFWGLMTGYERTDVVLAVQLKASVDITRALAFELAYNLELNSDPLLPRESIFGTCVDAPCNSANVMRDYVGYQRHAVLGSLILRY
jgi:hypothetical protein